MSLFYKEYLAPFINERSQVIRGSVFLTERKELSKSGDGELLSVSEYSGVTRRKDNLEEGAYLSRAETLEGYRLVRKNDLVMNYMLAWKGALGVSDIEGITSPAYSVFLINSEYAEPRFIHALFRSELFRAYFRTESTGIIESRLRLYPEALMSLKMVLPPLNEQQNIAIQLDRETARIDKLIEKKTLFIKLLREKRQALITQAVTKGLNTNVKMKDSGVEWLGQVPEHWNVCLLQYIISGIEQGWSPECMASPAEDGQWGIVKSGCVNGGVFNYKENKALPDDLAPQKQYEIKTGDVLMSRASGSPELIGSVALVSFTQEKLMLSDKIFRIHCSEKVLASYLVWLLGSTSLRAQIEQAISGAEGLANNLPQSRIKKFWVVCPSIDEQQLVIDYLDEETARINALIAKNQQSLDLLKERRTALITAAVTGQIDLREAAP